MTWKPISDYPMKPTDRGAIGPLVLARTEDKTPYLVVMKDGHFFVCPGVPVFFGDRQLDFLRCNHVIEFMEIPK